MSTMSPHLKEANRRDNAALRAMRRGGGRAKKSTIVARVNVGLEETEWHWICDLAHGTDCTISEIIREIVRDACDRCLRESDL